MVPQNSQTSRSEVTGVKEKKKKQLTLNMFLRGMVPWEMRWTNMVSRILLM